MEGTDEEGYRWGERMCSPFACISSAMPTYAFVGFFLQRERREHRPVGMSISLRDSASHVNRRDIEMGGVEKESYVAQRVSDGGRPCE